MSECCTKLSRTTNIAPTILARDYKGFGNQDMLAIIETKKNNVKVRFYEEVKADNR